MNKLLGNLKEGLFFVVSAPAGTGKNTLVNLLKSEFLCVEETVSCTTREKRDGEKNGYEYFFISRQEFLEKVKQKAFVEHKLVFKKYYYGTLKSEVNRIKKQGKHVVAVIDVQGALQIKKQTDAILIFIKPPSLEVLKKRLKKRGTENLQEIKKRLQTAQKEIQKSVFYDYVFVNDDLDRAYQVLLSILIAEERRNRKVKKQSVKSSYKKKVVN